MEPSELGSKYDKIAQWWHEQHFESCYGVRQFEQAVALSAKAGKALDVGCGAGGRFVRILEQHGFTITGVDVSKNMVELAGKNHPEHKFIHHDICTWQTEERFDFIVAWDSIFHLPLTRQKTVVSKLCQLLTKGGILIYTFGNAQGEHRDHWCGDTFYYSSIGINNNLQLLIDNGLSVLHLELDQYPQTHVYTVACKP
ncbi:class I SAM-dependent methyltransferase [Alteromonas gilva]|uniref:Class I SAM-dependent methyltransferase n=1 Tax=Alteromonas gilva TaxID=2987522 RepID=A0ABT5L586_9ALTE|nr:class I SAM-dependent methyltransferase [Alteromonas gilva]MDC8831022.1 class I SAM-dependent methyltransferase [Alteromonas gilva]